MQVLNEIDKIQIVMEPEGRNLTSLARKFSGVQPADRRFVRPQTGKHRDTRHMSIAIAGQNPSQTGGHQKQQRPISSQGIASNSVAHTADYYCSKTEQADLAVLDKQLQKFAGDRGLVNQTTDPETLLMSAGKSTEKLESLGVITSAAKRRKSGQSQLQNKVEVLSLGEASAVKIEQSRKSLTKDQIKTIQANRQNVRPVSGMPRNRMLRSKETMRSSVTQFKNEPQVHVQKKRTKSTYAGGIRGSQLIQDRFSGRASQQFNSKRKLKKDIPQSIAQLHEQQSTKAGNSSIASRTYHSYAPTSLLKIGMHSVQRLKPRIPYDSAKKITKLVRPTTARLEILETSISNFQSEARLSYDKSSAGMTRPQSQAKKYRRFKEPNAAHKSMNISGHLRQIAATTIEQSKNTIATTLPDFDQMRTISNVNVETIDYVPPTFGDQGDSSNDEKFVMSDNMTGANPGPSLETNGNEGFKLVSQFETEDDAKKYASELQKYYDSRKMDVQVQIEMNLEDLDDTPDQKYLSEAIENYQRDINQRNSLEAQMAERDKMVEKIHVQRNIKRAFNSHFQKNEQISERTSSLIKRNDDLTAPKFQRKVNPKIAKENREYNKLSQNDIDELMDAQLQIHGVISPAGRIPTTPYQNFETKHRRFKQPNFKFEKEVDKTRMKEQASQQAGLLRRIGVLQADLQGDVPQASQLMTNDNGIPKSRAKFYQREQRMKKKFDEKVASWHVEEHVTGKDHFSQAQSQISAAEREDGDKFVVDVRPYKERDDDFAIIGNKMQYRASEQNATGRNYCNRQALETKGKFDPIRIRLRIMPVSKAPLAQGKTPDYYFVQAAKKSLSGDLLNAIELLKRGLIINPNHLLCRFNHGVLMFKFGLIKEAEKDFQQLTTHKWGQKDPWVYYNLATCMIQTAHPDVQPQRQNTRHRMTSFNTQQSKPPRHNLLQADVQKASNSFKGMMRQSTRMPNHGRKVYLEAVAMCEKAYMLAISEVKSDIDYEIMIDSLNLQGVCLFRLGKLLDAVAMLNKSNFLREKLEEEEAERRRAMMIRNDMDDLVGQYFTKRDMIAISKRRSSSFDFKRHKKLRQPPKRLLTRQHSWAAHEILCKEQAAEFTRDCLIDMQANTSSSDEQRAKSDDEASCTPTDERQSHLTVSNNQKYQDAKRILESEKSDMEKISREIEARDRSDKSPSVYQTINTIAGKASDDVTSKRSQSSKQISASQISADRNGKKADGQASRKGKVVGWLGDNKSRESRKKTLQKALLQKVAEMTQKLRPVVMKPDKIEDLMRKLEDSKQQLTRDRESLHMSKGQYALFRKIYLAMRKSSDEVIDGASPLLKLKNLYLRTFAPDETEYNDCNLLEIAALKKRAEINKWAAEDMIQQMMAQTAQVIASGEDQDDQAANARFVEQLLSQAQVKFEEIAGTHIETVVDIIIEQSEMDGIMDDLRVKIEDMCRSFEKELRRGMEELCAAVPKLDEIKILRGERHTDLEDQQDGQEDKMITHLRDALNNEDVSTPDEVINILTNSVFEKEKMKLRMEYCQGGSDDENIDEAKIFLRRKQIALKDTRRTKVKQDMRYTERHVDIIRTQLAKSRDCNYKVLDMMMRHLRFLKRLEKDERQQIYKAAELVEVPPQTVLFEMGDEADYMYIILKGRVVISNRLFRYKDISRILTTLKDGEEFGSMNIVESSEPESDDIASQTLRQVTAKTVETSRMLRISVTEVNAITRPPAGHEGSTSQGVSLPPKADNQQRSSKQGSNLNSILPGRENLATPQMKDLQSLDSGSQFSIPQSEPKDYQADELQQRLSFLNSCEIFSDIKKGKVLLPVAVNMMLVKFKYGEFLTRGSEVPPGMYIIKSGQCIVGVSRTATRPKNYQDIPGSRKPVVDKHPLFNNYDAENTLLNSVEIPDRVFQNQRIYVENDNQVRDKIIYNDFLHYSKLFPKKQFGGRVLLPFELYMQLRRIYFGHDAVKKPESLQSKVHAKGSSLDLNGTQASNKHMQDELGTHKKKEHYQMQSFLDVVADSAVVEAYLITKTAIQYLADNHLKNIYEIIVQEKEPDRPMREDKIIQKRDKMLNDQEVSLAEVKRIMFENKIEKYGVMAIKSNN